MTDKIDFAEFVSTWEWTATAGEWQAIMLVLWFFFLVGVFK